MAPNQLIEVSLKTRSGERVELVGVVLTIRFFVNGVYRFGFRSKPTDSSGQVLITYDFLEEARLRNSEIQPLDYRTTFEECDSLIRIALPSMIELNKAADILETMGRGRFRGLSDSWKKASNGLLVAEECRVDVTGGVNRCELVVTRL